MSISSKEFEERIQRVEKETIQAGFEALVIYGLADVRYLSNYGVLAGSAVVILTERKDPVLLIDQEWDLVRAKDCSMLDDTRAVDFTKEIPKILSDAHVTGKIGISGWNSFPAPVYISIKEALPEAQIVDATNITNNIRLIKSPSEIKILERAAKATSTGMNTCIKAIRKGRTEREIATKAEISLKLAGADEISFPTIFGSGAKTALNDPFPSSKRLKSGELVLMDMGGRVEGYFGDMSRAKGCGRVGKEEIDLFNAVLQIQKQVIKSVKPGIRASELHKITKRMASEFGYEKYVIHPTGHGLGLELHEGPWLDDKDETVLKPGMVHSVEPGLYIPNLGGVRIEDMILVTETGGRALTSASKDL